MRPDNRSLIRSGEARLVGWSRQMLYSGFNTLPRSVFWSAYFNGRSDNLDVIPLALRKMVNLQTVHLLDCNCGNSVRIPRGRVGIPFSCENCDSIPQIDSLAVLNALPAIQVSPPKKDSFSFSIATLAKLTALISFLCFVWLKIPTVATVVYTLALMAVAYLFVVALVGFLLLWIPSLVRSFWDRFYG